MYDDVDVVKYSAISKLPYYRDGGNGVYACVWRGRNGGQDEMDRRTKMNKLILDSRKLARSKIMRIVRRVYFRTRTRARRRYHFLTIFRWHKVNIFLPLVR